MSDEFYIARVIPILDVILCVCICVLDLIIRKHYNIVGIYKENESNMALSEILAFPTKMP